jgi:hypothetical protein
MKLCKNSKCNNGYVFDEIESCLVPCPWCLEEKEKHLIEGVNDNGLKVSLAEKLGFKRRFLSVELEPIKLFGRYTFNQLDKDVLKPMVDNIQSVISTVSKGRVPVTSMLYYLGAKADFEMLGFTLLAGAYKGGLTVGSLMTPMRIRELRGKVSEYSEYTRYDFVVLVFSPNILDDLAIVEDFLRDRALNGKPTVCIVTSGYGINGAIQRLCSYEEYRLDTCLYVGIPSMVREDTDEKKVSRINKAIENSNAILNVKTPTITVDDLSKTDVKRVVEKESVPKVTIDDIWGSK